MLETLYSIVRLLLEWVLYSSAWVGDGAPWIANTVHACLVTLPPIC